MKMPNVSIDLGKLDFNFKEHVAKMHAEALNDFDDYYEDSLKDAIYDLLINNLPQMIREAALQVADNAKAMEEMEINLR